MHFYHRTTETSAQTILKSGFKDRTGTYGTGNKFGGVFLSNEPLDANEGATGDVLLELTCALPESWFSDYEWVEEGKPYREWCTQRQL